MKTNKIEPPKSPPNRTHNWNPTGPESPESRQTQKDYEQYLNNYGKHVLKKSSENQAKE